MSNPGVNARDAIGGLGTVMIDTANVIARRGVLDAGVAFLQKPFTIVQSLGEKARKVLDAPLEPPGQP